jgi:hypothetical protein
MIKRIDMELRIENQTSVSDLQKQFNTYFPYLQLEFFTAMKVTGKSQKAVRVSPNQQIRLLLPGIYRPVQLGVNSETTVGDLLKSFKDIGLNAQISRRSGNLWIETTFTDDWTLERQNKEAILFSLSNQQFMQEKKQLRN